MYAYQILSHVDRHATCSGCAVGLYGLHSSVLCITHALKTWIKAVPGRSCYAGLPASVCRLSPCIDMVGSSCLQHSYSLPTNADTTRLRCVLNMNACIFLAVQSYSRVLWRSVALPLSYPDPRENVDRASTKGHACCLSPVLSHSILARLDLPPLFVGFGAREYPLLYSPYFLTLSQQMPNSKNRTQRRLAYLSKDRSGSCSTIHAQNPTPRNFVITPKKVGHLTSSGHRPPATAVHLCKKSLMKVCPMIHCQTPPCSTGMSPQ